MDGGGSGPGDSFDPCECICSHEGAMRRLISLLRDSQSYCTDNQCSPELPGPQGSDTGGNNHTAFFIMMIWIVIAFVLYLLRPQSMRQGAEKPSRNDRDPGPQPPAPPVH